MTDHAGESRGASRSQLAPLVSVAELAEALRAERERAGLSLRALADTVAGLRARTGAVAMSYQTLGEFTGSGKRVRLPNEAQLRTILAACGTEADRTGYLLANRAALAEKENRNKLQIPSQSPSQYPVYRATIDEISARTPKLVARESDLAQLRDAIFGPSGYHWITAGIWTGKTALLAKFVQQSQPESVDVAAYFLSRREADADSRRFLSAIIPQLADIAGVAVPSIDVHEYRHLWSLAAQRASAISKPLVLVVDGIDEDQLSAGSPSVASLLPTQLGTHGHVFVSTRSADLPPGLSPRHPLTTTEPGILSRSQVALEISVLAESELSGVLDLGRPDPLTLQVIAVLAAAAGPLSVEDIAGIISAETRPAASLIASVGNTISRDCSRLLEKSGLHQPSRYQFAHSSLFEVAGQGDAITAIEMHDAVERWVHLWRQQGWVSNREVSERIPRYLFDAYPFTPQIGEEELQSLVTDLDWIVGALQCISADLLIALLNPFVSDFEHSPPAKAYKLRGIVTGQSSNFRSIGNPSKSQVLRHLCLEALHHDYSDISAEFRLRLEQASDPGLVPIWSSRRVGRTLVANLGHHDGWVQSVLALSNGTIISGGNDARVAAWDRSGVPIKNTIGKHQSKPGWAGHAGGGRPNHTVTNGGINAVLAIGEGSVVTAGGDGQILRWDLAESGAPQVIGEHPGEIRILILLADGRVATVGPTTSGRTFEAIRVWDPVETTGNFVEFGWPEAWVQAATGLKGTNDIAVALREGEWGSKIYLLDTSTNDGRPTPLGHAEDFAVTCMIADSSGSLLLGDSDGSLWILNTRLGFTFVGSHGSKILSLTAFDDGRTITGGVDGRILIWETSLPGADPREVGRHDSSGVSSLTALENRLVVSGGEDGFVRLWRTDRSLLYRPDITLVQESSIAFLRDDLLVCKGEDGRVRLRDVSRSGADTVTTVGQFPGKVEAETQLRDGSLLFADAYTGSRTKITPPPESPLREYEDAVRGGYQDEYAQSYTVVGDGIVTGGFDGGLRYRGLNALNAEPVEFGAHDGPVERVVSTPLGKVASIGYDNEVIVWDLTRPARMRRAWARLTRYRQIIQRSFAVDQVRIGEFPGLVALVATSTGHFITVDDEGVAKLFDTETPGQPGVSIGDLVHRPVRTRENVKIGGRLYGIDLERFALGSSSWMLDDPIIDSCVASGRHRLYVTVDEDGLRIRDSDGMTRAEAMSEFVSIASTVGATGETLIAACHRGHGVTLWRW